MNTYCVVCRDTSSGHAIRFFLGAASANYALVAAAEEYPAFRVLGIEPRDYTPVTRTSQNAA